MQQEQIDPIRLQLPQETLHDDIRIRPFRSREYRLDDTRFWIRSGSCREESP
jgi:hypothetical protein